MPGLMKEVNSGCMQSKSHIKIILSRTWSPGNVGSVVRAMKNFGFTDLTCVNQININPAETAVMAAGAEDKIPDICYSDSLPEQTAQAHIVYAFSGRERKHYTSLTPREMAAEIVDLPESCNIVLLFGNETNGLNNEELDFADKIVTIPAEDDYPSLNLAQAVMIALYELQSAFLNSQDKAPVDSSALLNHHDKEFLMTEIIQSAQLIINKEVNNKQIAENIRHFFKKSKTTAKESRFIHSLFRLILRRLNLKL